MKRRWMPVILACILCVCSYSTAVLAEQAEDNDLQLLIDLGILKEENKAELDRPVQRIAFVDLFSSIENVQGTAAWIKPGFTDVDLSADYADALAWLYMGGAVADAEYFYPDNNITREEAVKIMVTVLGYGSEAALSGGYPGGYMNTANRLHLFSGVQGSDFTLRSAGKMFLNALEAKTAAVKNGFYEKSETELTMLERFYGVSFSKGIMTKNTLTKLRPAMSDSAETIGVGDEEYVCTTEYDDYIGKSVTVYYRFGPEKENEVVGVYPSKKNRVVQFEVEYDTAFSDFTYEVYVENRVKKYKIGRSADVIYNGRVYTQYQEEELLPDNGNVTLIDSEDDGKFETVIINAYEVYIAGNGTGDGLIYDKLGKEPIDVNGDGDCIIKENGLAADFSKITLGDLLEIRRSRGDAHGLIQIDISRNVVSGALAAITESGRYFTVNGVQYEVSAALKALVDSSSAYLETVETGMNISLYLDRNGRVGYFTKEISDQVFYTYLRKIMVDSPDGDESAFFRIMLPDGTWKTVEAAKRVMVNGEKQKKEAVVEAVQAGTLKASQAIRCKLDKDGKLSMLETLTKYDVGYERLTYKRGSRTFDGYLSIANDCAVIVVPGAGFETDETMYEMRNAGYFRDGQNYTFDAYEVNDALVAEVVVIRGNGKNTDIPSTEAFMIVDSVYETLVDDEGCTGIKATAPAGAYEGVARDGAVEFIDRISGKYLPFSQLNKGDLIRILCDSTGKIINGERLVDYKKFQENKKRGAYTMDGGYRDGLLLRGGFVYAVYQDIIAVTKNSEIDLDSPDIMKNLVVYSAQTPAILVFDTAEETARAGSIQDIIAYQDFHSKDFASFVYIQSALGDPKYMVVYK